MMGTLLARLRHNPPGADRTSDVAVATDSSAFWLVQRKPPSTGPTVLADDVARFRELQVVHPSGVGQPTVVTLDLAGWEPSVPALVELIVPLAQGARSRSLGPLALVVCTDDPSTRDVLRALAETYDLALFVAPAVDRLGEAEPFGLLTETERETLAVMQRLGGSVSVAKFADATGLAPTAATNRLVSVVQKGFLQKVERPRPAGAKYLDPRAALVIDEAAGEQLPAAARRELEIFAAVAGLRPEELLAAAHAEREAAGDAAGVTLLDAWQAYRERHAGQLSERLRWAQEMLADSRRAAVEMSGMSDEDLDELRREFG